MIRASDRLADVLARDERMLEIFLAASPQLQGLRNPVARRVMGRLATVAQVARIAGLEPDVLVHRVNHALEPKEREQRDAVGPTGPNTSNREQAMNSISAEAPPTLKSVPAELVLELDVRPELRAGREPFSQIMAARRELQPGGVLKLLATFEPFPLYAVMGKQGFDHWTEERAADDWCVWFYPAADAGASDVTTTAPAGAAAPVQAGSAVAPAAETAEAEGEDIIVLDVRGMEPPEPMVETLAALETLPDGKTLLQINERVPQFLLPKLEELGFTHEVREQAEGVVRVFIRRKSAS